MTTMTEPTTQTLDAPGATLTYDVRPRPGRAEPPLFLIGSPMGAGGFGTLAGHFPDRTVVTYDPRGVERSMKADPSHPVHARAARRRPAPDHRRSSARARSTCSPAAAARSTRWPSSRSTRRTSGRSSRTSRRSPRSCPIARARWPSPQAIADTYQRSGFGPAMAQFIAVVSHKGPMTPEFAAQPAPDPAMFGMPAEDDGTRTDPLLVPEHHHLHPLRAGLRRRCGGLDPDRARRRRRVGGRDGPPRRRGRRRAARHRSRSSSRAATAASSAASTASPASPIAFAATSSARSSRADTPPSPFQRPFGPRSSGRIRVSRTLSP